MLGTYLIPIFFLYYSQVFKTPTNNNNNNNNNNNITSLVHLQKKMLQQAASKGEHNKEPQIIVQDETIPKPETMIVSVVNKQLIKSE